MRITYLFTFFALVFVLASMSACNMMMPGSQPTASAEMVMPDVDETVVTTEDEHPGMILKSGDKLKITVLNDEEVSGQYRIDLMGNITLPMIGALKAAYVSTRDLQQTITDKLSEGYLVNPQVTIEVLNLRPFYILGAVNKPGTYPSEADLNVFKAIAIAGGLTPRADSRDYIIYRGKGPGRQEIEADDETPVMPGDSIRVEERLF